MKQRISDSTNRRPPVKGRPVVHQETKKNACIKGSSPLVPSPSEETILYLNMIVLQSPFCYRFREKRNDPL